MRNALRAIALSAVLLAAAVAPALMTSHALVKAAHVAHQAKRANPSRHVPVLPPTHGVFDYQLGGQYSPARDVLIVDRDHTEPAVAGRYNICYVNAFQTQPADDAAWTSRHGRLLVRSRTGTPLADPDWPGELILNTSTAAARAALAALIEPILDQCAARGYQAVEADNLDSYTRSDGQLTAADNEAFAATLTAYAHSRGLAVGQKNAADLAVHGRALGFDFAVAEECQVYDECSAYTDAYGRHVIEIEYTDNGTGAYTQACRLRGRQVSVILRDRLVTPRGDPDYRYQHCG